ncbi:TIGR03619 family F420-dependent LLM class oxidoreductase [Saccharomonospora sp. NPDC046836]|uniref:TIGR03619 family F420-dependent LLM class oxidoreductase n=1 Tax=Saccharomonospora sp. NPDC046836 TaxID=3156921 RepID=UPI0033D6F026
MINDETRPLRVGLVLPARGSLATGPAVAEAAEAAEATGMTTVWATDHIVFPANLGSSYPYTANSTPNWDHQASWLEAIVALTWAAARTTRVRLGTAVLVLPIRSVVHTAKQVASLDHLCGGRVLLGVGAGWLREEFDYLGMDFPSRGKRLSEGMRLLRACWDSDPITFSGPTTEIADAIMQPKPAQGSRVPLLVGGHSRSALRRTAELADGWVASQLGPDEIRRGCAELAELAAGIGRPDMPEVFARLPVGTKVDGEVLDTYRAAGVDELLVDLHTTARDMGEYLDRLHALAAVRDRADA